MACRPHGPRSPRGHVWHPDSQFCQCGNWSRTVDHRQLEEVPKVWRWVVITLILAVVIGVLGLGLYIWDSVPPYTMPPYGPSPRVLEAP